MNNIDYLKELIIKYNLETYNLNNPNNDLNIIINNNTYEIQNTIKTKPIINISYKKYNIIGNNILECYVILQYIFDVSSLNELANLNWDYKYWKVNITSIKKLPDWANILNCLLNLIDNFNIPIDIQQLEKIVTLNDKRGWGGERPREIYYKFGFPLYTHSTKKSISNSQRLFECPFPICKINPYRKAIIINNNNEKKCFTCGTKEGELNYFGNICNFEKGHFDPHINGCSNLSGFQCKWCNSFYKDKISWNIHTGKPSFNIYAILRDAPKLVLIKQLKQLGFTSTDFE